MEKKNKLIIFVLGTIFISAFFFWKMQRNDMQNTNTIYCKSDKDCLLYDCTSCGTKDWVLKNNKNTNCDKKIPGLIGCRCQDNVCKREYQKK